MTDTQTILNHAERHWRQKLQDAVPTSMRGQLRWEVIKRSIGYAMENSDTLRACQADSVLLSLLHIVSLGLDPSGLTGEAYLIPRGTECTAMVGYQGMIALAYRSGRIAKIMTAVVHENDEHDHDLANGHLAHRYDWSKDDRGRPLFGWARVWLVGVEEPILEIMPWSEIMKAKAAGQGAQPAWRNWPDEMARKTVLKRALKWAPKSTDLVNALAHEAMQDASGNREPVATTQPTDTVQPTGRGALRLPDRQAERDIEHQQLDEFTNDRREREVVHAKSSEKPKQQAKPEPAPDPVLDTDPDDLFGDMP